MRDFFLKILNSLDKLTGLQQMNKLLATPEPKKEINELLDILCRVSKQFGHIPESEQQRIINEKIISDQEFIGLNAKVLFKWLSGVSGGYIKPEVEALPEGYKVLEGDDREKMIQEWLKSLNGLQTNVDPKLPAGERAKVMLEDLPKYTGYKQLDTDEVDKRALHLEWIKKHHDPRTGKPLENWIPENEFITNHEQR